jgi:hypothetical protein
VIQATGRWGDSYERSVEAEAILAELRGLNACQVCRRRLRTEYVGLSLVSRRPARACRSVAKSVRTAWMACPYCTADRVPLRPQPVPQAQGDSGSLSHRGAADCGSRRRRARTRPAVRP